MFFKKKKEPEQIPNTKVTIHNFLKTYKTQANVKTAFFVAIISFGFANVLWTQSEASTDDHIAVINMKGPVQESNISANGNRFAQSLDKALKDDHAKAIVVVADSPGGSPVESEIMYKALKKATLESDKEIIVSIKGMCASACYMAVSPAAKIYAHEFSLIGSIGVRMDVFNVHELTERVGIERVTLAKGENKAMLDMYQPKSQAHIDQLKENMLNPMYDLFVEMVKRERYTEKEATPDIFSGMMWMGENAIQKGLIDEISTTHELLAALKTKYDVDAIMPYGGKAFKLSSFFDLSNVLSDAKAEMSPKVEMKY